MDSELRESLGDELMSRYLVKEMVSGEPYGVEIRTPVRVSWNTLNITVVRWNTLT